MKTCTKCLLDKDRSEYYTKDGGRLHAECKACFIKRKQESYYDKKSSYNPLQVPLVLSVDTTELGTPQNYITKTQMRKSLALVGCGGCQKKRLKKKLQNVFFCVLIVIEKYMQVFLQFNLLFVYWLGRYPFKVEKTDRNRYRRPF